MNFLGHLALSGEDPLVITGNFMADAVKGRDLSRFAPGIERGIRLHRAIDVFTDAHHLTLSGRDRLRAHAGHYAGVVLDLFYDHLLAAEWAEHVGGALPAFAQRMYTLLQEHRVHLPERTQRMLPIMVQGDWLSGYARIEGLARALDGLSRRALNGVAMKGAERVLVDNYPAYRSEFGAFFVAVKDHTRSYRA